MRRSTAFSASPSSRTDVPIADVQNHGVVILGLKADGPISRRKKNLDFGAAEIEFISFPMAHDFDS